MMRSKLAVAAVATLGVVSASPAAAVTTFLSNFDTVSFSSGVHTVSSIEGWTATGNRGIEVQTGGVFGAAKSGANLIELDTTGNSGMTRLIDAGVYTLSFAYSARPGAAIDTTGISIYLGNTLLRTVSGTGLNRNGSPKTTTSWLTFTATFTAAQASQLRFAAVGISDGLGGYLDNISLTGTPLPAVPEPGEWAMLLAGLGVIGAVARRRRTL